MQENTHAGADVKTQKQARNLSININQIIKQSRKQTSRREVKQATTKKVITKTHSSPSSTHIRRNAQNQVKSANTKTISQSINRKQKNTNQEHK